MLSSYFQLKSSSDQFVWNDLCMPSYTWDATLWTYWSNAWFQVFSSRHLGHICLEVHGNSFDSTEAWSQLLQRARLNCYAKKRKRKVLCCKANNHRTNHALQEVSRMELLWIIIVLSGILCTTYYLYYLASVKQMKATCTAWFKKQQLADFVVNPQSRSSEKLDLTLA